jgi:methylamine utilization protein MauE
MDYQVSLFMLGAVARLTIAVIFALAAIHALREWTVFSGIVEQYRIAPRRLAMIAARILPPLELAAAAALLLPVSSSAGAVLGSCLMALFTGAIMINIARGRVSIDCGCGGADGQKLSTGLVLRNVGLMGGLAIAGAAPSRGAIDGMTAIGVICASLALIALYFAINQLMTNFQTFSAQTFGATSPRSRS